MTPQWVLDLLERAEANSVTGFITINMRSGAYRDVKVEETYFPPPSAGSTLPMCPKGCGPMTETDGGAMYVCRCGTKRTRAQLLAQSNR